MTLTDKLLEGERLNGGERLYLLQLVEADERRKAEDRTFEQMALAR